MHLFLMVLIIAWNITTQNHSYIMYNVMSMDFFKREEDWSVKCIMIYRNGGKQYNAEKSENLQVSYKVLLIL